MGCGGEPKEKGVSLWLSTGSIPAGPSDTCAEFGGACMLAATDCFFLG